MAPSDAEMSIEQFTDLLDHHGPDIMKWPQEHRENALDLALRTQSARDMINFDANLIRLIKASPAPKAPTGLTARIMKKIKE